MKGCERHWPVAGALAIVLLAGCASEGYVGTDDGYHHHRRWAHREYDHRYVGRPPGYSQGGEVEVYVAPEPAHRYRW